LTVSGNLFNNNNFDVSTFPVGTLSGPSQEETKSKPKRRSQKLQEIFASHNYTKTILWSGV